MYDKFGIMSVLRGTTHMSTNPCVVPEQRVTFFVFAFCFNRTYPHLAGILGWSSPDVRLDVKSSNSIADSGTRTMKNVTDVQKFLISQEIWAARSFFYTISYREGKNKDRSKRVYVKIIQDHLQHPGCPRIPQGISASCVGTQSLSNHPSIKSARFCCILFVAKYLDDCQELGDHLNNFRKCFDKI